MKILKKIGIGILTVILVLVIVSFFLPRHVHVERSIEMNTTADNVFPLVNNVKNWIKWSPWHKKDPNTTWEFGNVDEGVGAWYTWKSEHPEVGNGKLSIIESTPNEHIKTAMDFMENGKATSDYMFMPTANGVKVVWTMDSDMGMNPIGKWFGLFMDKMIGKDFEEGLKMMKEAAESGPQKETISGFDFEQRDMRSMIIAGIREKVQFKDLSGEKFGMWYGTIGKKLGLEKIEPAGPPMAVYYSYDKKNMSADMEAAMPVKTKGIDDKTVKFHELPATKALVVKYYGDYSKTEPVYEAAYTYIAQKGMKDNGPPMEIFVTDPGNEKDTAKWLTEIVFPVQ